MTARRNAIAPGPGWQGSLALLERGTVLIVGEAGTGKSALAGYLTSQLHRGLRRVAWIDADPAQAEVGPGGCQGLALTRPWRAPAGLWFVADADATRRPAATVAGAATLARRAREAGAELVVLDPPAATGDDARELLVHLAAAAGVDQVVSLERDRELTPLLEVLSPRVSLHRLGVAAGARPASPEARRERLEARLKAHLARARSVRFSKRRLRDASLAPLAEPVVGSVVGLLGEDGLCLGLGVVEDVGSASVAILTTVDRPGVATVQAGGLRCERTGEAPADAPGAEWRLLRAG